MSSHRERDGERGRKRSWDRDDDRGHSEQRDDSRSPETDPRLPSGASPISESDYFLKSDEFRVWLKEEKGKYFDELSGDRARSYFKKFVKAWNRGKLSKTLYAGLDGFPQSAKSNTAYQWSFASDKSRVDTTALDVIREEVNSATQGRSSTFRGAGSTSAGGSGSRVMGPTLPSASDVVLAREAAAEYEQTERQYRKKRDREEAKERVEDMVGPKAVGREGMLEKKRARRDNDRAFREKGDDGFEADDKTLMGGGDSFKEQIARRDAARRRFQEKREADRAERMAAGQADAIREKDKATMDMFMKLARERFG